MTTQVCEPSGQLHAEASAVYQPAVDIVETDQAIELIADLPGVDEAGAEIDVEKNVLTIRGTVPLPDYDGYKLTHAEYGVGNFERSFTISNEIDQSAIEASMRDGVLTIRLPKIEPVQAKKIVIAAG